MLCERKRTETNYDQTCRDKEGIQVPGSTPPKFDQGSKGKTQGAEFQEGGGERRKADYITFSACSSPLTNVLSQPYALTGKREEEGEKQSRDAILQWRRDSRRGKKTSTVCRKGYSTNSPLKPIPC